MKYVGEGYTVHCHNVPHSFLGNPNPLSPQGRIPQDFIRVPPTQELPPGLLLFIFLDSILNINFISRFIHYYFKEFQTQKIT